MFYGALQHHYIFLQLLTEKFNEILGHFRRNVPYGQIIEPKGKGGSISASDCGLFSYSLKSKPVHTSSFYLSI